MSERRAGPHESPASQPWCWPHSSPDLFSFPSSIPSSPNIAANPLLVHHHTSTHPSPVHHQHLPTPDQDGLSDGSQPHSPTSVRDAALPCHALDGLQFHPPDVPPPSEQLAGSSDALRRGNMGCSKQRLNKSMNVEHCSLPEQGREDFKSNEARGNVFPVPEDHVDDVWRTDRRCTVVLHDCLVQGSCVEFLTTVDERSYDRMERDSNHQNGLHFNKDDEAMTLDIDKYCALQSTNSTGGMLATDSRHVGTLTRDKSEADSEMFTCAVVEHSSNKLETLPLTVDAEQLLLSKDVKSHSMVTRTGQADERASRVQHHESKRVKKMRGRGAGDKTTSHPAKETARQITSFKDRRDQDVAGKKVILRAGNKKGYVVRQGTITGTESCKKIYAPRKVKEYKTSVFSDETATNNSTASPTKKKGEDFSRRRPNPEKELRQRVVNKGVRSASDARYRCKIKTKLADLMSIFDFDPASDPLTCSDSRLVQDIDWVHLSAGSGSKEKGMFGNSKADSNNIIAKNNEMIGINGKRSDGNNNSNAIPAMNGNSSVGENDRYGLIDSNDIIGINGSNSVGNNDSKGIIDINDDSSVDNNDRNIIISNNSNGINGFTGSSSSQEQSLPLSGKSVSTRNALSGKPVSTRNAVSGKPVSTPNEIKPKRKYNKRAALKKKDLVMWKTACVVGKNELPAAMIRSDTGDWRPASSRKCFALEPVPSCKLAMQGQPLDIHSPKPNGCLMGTVLNPYSMVNPNLVLDVAQLYGSTEVSSNGIVKLEERSVVPSKRSRGRRHRGHSIKRGINRQVPSPMSSDVFSPFWSASPIDTLWGCSSAPCQTSSNCSGMDSQDESDCLSSKDDSGVFEEGGRNLYSDSPFGGNSGDWLSDRDCGDDLMDHSSEAVGVPLQGELRESILINAHKYILEEEEKWTTLMRNASGLGVGQPSSVSAPSVQAIRAAFSGLLDQYGERWRTTLFDTCKEDREAVVKAGAHRYANQIKEALTTVAAQVKTPPRDVGQRESRLRTLNSQTQHAQTQTQYFPTQNLQTQTRCPSVGFVASSQGAVEKEYVGLAVGPDNINRGMIYKEEIRPPSVREDNKCENTHHQKIAVKHGSPLIRKPLRLVVLPKRRSFPPPKQRQQLHVDTMQTCHASPTLQFCAKENVAREPDGDCSVLAANTLQTGNVCPTVKFCPTAVTMGSAFGDGCEKATGRKVDIYPSPTSNPSTLLPETTDRLNKNTLSISVSCASTNTTSLPAAAEPTPCRVPSQPVRSHNPNIVTVSERFSELTSAPGGIQAAGPVVQQRLRESVALPKNSMRKTKSSIAKRTLRLFSSNSTGDDNTPVRSVSFTDSVAPSKHLDTTTVLTVVNPCMGTEPIEVEYHQLQSAHKKPLMARNFNSSPASLKSLKPSPPAVTDESLRWFRAPLATLSGSDVMKKSLPNASQNDSAGKTLHNSSHVNVAGQSRGCFINYPLIDDRSDLESLTDPRSDLKSLVDSRGCLESLTGPRSGLESLTVPRGGLESHFDPPCGLKSLANPGFCLESFTDPQRGFKTLTDPRGGLESYSVPPGGLKSLANPGFGLEPHADPRGGHESFIELQGLLESFPDPQIDLEYCIESHDDRKSEIFNSFANVEVSMPRSGMEDLVRPQHPSSGASSLAIGQVDLTAGLEDQYQFVDSFIGGTLNDTRTQPVTSRTGPTTKVTNTSASHNTVDCLDSLLDLNDSNHYSGLVYHVMPAITQFDGPPELLADNSQSLKVKDFASLDAIGQSAADVTEYFEQVMDQSQNRSHDIGGRNLYPSICANRHSDDARSAPLDSRARNDGVKPSCEQFTEHAYCHTPTLFSVPFNGSSERSLILPSKLSTDDANKPLDVISVTESLSLTQLCSSTGATMSVHDGKATIPDVSSDVGAIFEDHIPLVVSSFVWSGSLSASTSACASSGLPSSAIHKTKLVNCPVFRAIASQSFVKGTDTLDVASQEVKHNGLAAQVARGSNRCFGSLLSVVPSISAVRPTLPPSNAVRPTLLPSNAVRPTLLPSNAVRPTLPSSNAVRPTLPPSNAVRPTLPPFSAVATPRKRGPKIPTPRSPKCARSLIKQFSTMSHESSGEYKMTSSSLQSTYEDLPLRQLDDYFC